VIRVADEIKRHLCIDVRWGVCSREENEWAEVKNYKSSAETEHEWRVPVGLEIDKILRQAKRVAQGTLSPTVIAWLGQNHTSRAAVDFNREMKEPCGRWFV